MTKETKTVLQILDRQAANRRQATGQSTCGLYRVTFNHGIATVADVETGQRIASLDCRSPELVAAFGRRWQGPQWIVRRIETYSTKLGD